jgi:hypothetical protein
VPHACDVYLLISEFLADDTVERSKKEMKILNTQASPVSCIHVGSITPHMSGTAS